MNNPYCLYRLFYKVIPGSLWDYGSSYNVWFTIFLLVYLLYNTLTCIALMASLMECCLRTLRTFYLFVFSLLPGAILVLFLAHHHIKVVLIILLPILVSLVM